MNVAWIARVLEALGRMSAQAAVLVLLVLVTQRLFRRWLTPRWRCALWLLVVGRIVMPASLPTRVSVFNLVPRTASEDISSTGRIVSSGVEHSTRVSTLDAAASGAQAMSATGETQEGVANLAIETGVEPATHEPQVVSAPPAIQHYSQIPWPVLLLAAWLAGAVGLAAHVIMASVRVARRFRGLPEVSDPNVLAVLEECRTRTRVRTPLRLVEGAEVRSPALRGVFRPRLLLPAGFTRSFSLAELQFVFLHELAHVTRRDVLMNWVVALLQVVHWFNPVLWFGFMRWRADRELACDALALETAGANRNRDYGRTILRLLEAFTERVAAPGLVGIVEDKRQLQQRIGMIASFVPQKRWSLLAMLLFLALAMVGLTDGQTPEPKAKAAANRDPKSGNVLILAADQNDAPRLILERMRFQYSGKTNQAEAMWRAALELDPDNEVARDYLAKIGRTNLPSAKPNPQPVVLPVPNPIPRTNFTKMSEGRRRINSMLDTIRLDSVAFDGLPLSEVIKAIDMEALNRDPEKKGINFLIPTPGVPHLSPSPAIDPLNGLPVAAGDVDVGATTIRIAPAQKDITLHQLLDIIVLVADRPIKYSVQDFGVLITLRGLETPTLYTRWFKIEPNTFMNRLQASGIESTNSTARTPREEIRWLDRGGIDYTAVKTSQDIAITMIKDYFMTVGVDLGTPPRSVVFNDRLGMLMVHTTLTDCNYSGRK